MTEKDQLYAFLCIRHDDEEEDAFEMPCKTPIKWDNNRDSADAGCTWIEPFSLDGIDPEGTIIFEIRLLVPGNHFVLVYRTETSVGVLTFHKPNAAMKPQLRKARRGSIYNRASMGFKSKTDTSVNNALQLAKLCVTYYAERRNDYIWLRVASIYMPAPVDRIGEIYSRTGTRMCLAINGRSVYKAHQVQTMDNNARIYTWVFDAESTISEYVNQTPRDRKNKDWDIDSETNSSHSVKCPEITEGAELSLRWTRTVFFPNPETGMLDKELTMLIQRADFDAVTRRIAVLSPRYKEKPPLILERSIRQNVLCKIEYVMSESSKSIVIVKNITLHVDMYPKTIEDAFKIN